MAVVGVPWDILELCVSRLVLSRPRANSLHRQGVFHQQSVHPVALLLDGLARSQPYHELVRIGRVG